MLTKGTLFQWRHVLQLHALFHNEINILKLYTKLLQAALEPRPLLQWQTVHQALELLLAQLDLVLQLALLDDEGRLHLHKVAVVVQALSVQVGLHDARHQPLAPVQVLLQLFGVLVLPHQQLALLRQGPLKKKKKKKDMMKILII